MSGEAPFWRQPPYVGMLADPYIGGTPLSKGHLALSVHAVAHGLGRIAQGENHSTRRLLEQAPGVTAERLGAVKKLFDACYSICEEIFADDIKEHPEKLLPVVKKVEATLRALPIGGQTLLPAGWHGQRTVGWLMYLVTRNGDTAYECVVVNGGAGLRYHPTQPTPEKMKYKTCCKIEKIPIKRMCDPAFWIMTFLLFTKDPPSEYSRMEVIYDVLLPWLAERTTAHPEEDGDATKQMSDILSKVFSGGGGGGGAPPPAASGASTLGASLLSALQAPAPTPAPAPPPPPGTQTLDLSAALAAAFNKPPGGATPAGAAPAAPTAVPSGLGASLLSALTAPAPAPAAPAPAPAKKPLRLLSEAFKETLADPHAAWRSRSQNSSHWKAALEACRYLLSQQGVPEQEMKLLTLALRKEFLVRAASDLLPCLRPDHPLITELRDRHDAQYTPVQLTEISAALEKANLPCVNNLGDPITPQDIIAGGAKVIGVYVGASWCKPCVAFTPRLQRLYKDLKPKGLEVIFVSADKTEEEHQAYFSDMPWLAVPYEVAGPVAKGLGIGKIPTLLLFDAADGSLITADGVAGIMKHHESFPWEDRSVLRPRVGDDDATLLNIGTEQFTRKALKEYKLGRTAEGCMHQVHALCDALLRAADAARQPDTAPIVTKSSKTDLAIKPVAMQGDTTTPPKFTPKGSVAASPFTGFEHFVSASVKKYEGKTVELTTPDVIDLLSIPTTMDTADDALAAIAKCEEVCELLYKKAAASTTTSRIVCHFQIIAVIGGLFTDIVPVPAPCDGDAADGCLWRGSFSGGAAAQKKCLELLHKLMLLYVSAWQSVERPTRGCDGERFLTAACVLCVYDAVLRQVYGDADTLLVTALFLEDGGYRMCTKLCQDGRSFQAVAAGAEFEVPAHLLRLGDVQRYLASLERTTGEELFDWRMPEKIEIRKYGATCLFLRKLLDRGGFPLIPDDEANPPCEMEALANWLTEDSTDLAERHPEFIWTRDMSALFRFAATMETRECELLRRRKDSTYSYWRLSFDDSLGARGGMWWVRRGPSLRWDVAGGIRGADLDIADLTVTGFNGRELRWGEGPIVHSPVDLKRVLGIQDASEDDVVHCRSLPNYGGTLSKEESERLFSSLTTRYMSIPLVLDFFASMDRHTYLFSTAMQSVLRSVLFEPGAWADAGATPPVIPHVPLRQTATQKKEAAVEAALSATFQNFDENLLGTPHGLLLNELRCSPGAVLTPLVSIARRCLDDLAACSVYSANAHFMSFMLTLLLDVYAFAEFARVDKAAAVAATPAADQKRAVEAEILRALTDGAAALRDLLQHNFLDVVKTWRAEAEKESDLSTACLMHAFTAMIAQHDPSADGVAGLVGSASYVRNWHGFGLGRARSDLLADSSDEGLSPKQRLLRFLQAQGIDTGDLSEASLDKYVSTTGRARPLFLHIGRDVLRVPTLVRTDAGTEDAAQAAKLPPWDLPETTLFRMLNAHRGRAAAYVADLPAGAGAGARDAFLNDIVRTALRNPGFSYTGWDVSGAARYQAARAELHVDIQQSEVLWRNDALKPVPDSMTQFPDFETIFGREALHCGVVRKTAHRHWVHLVGTAYDIEEWDEPDPADLGAGFPTELPKPDEAPLTDAQMAERMVAEEQAKAAADEATGDRSIWGGNKRRRPEDEPYLRIDDGVLYQGVRYTRAIDAYSNEPWEHPTEDWAVQIVREVIRTICPLSQPLKFCFYLPDVYAEAHVDEVTLLGVDHDTEENLTFKEARVSRKDKSMEVWLLNTHGRRMFKTLIFATNARVALHNLAPNAEKAYTLPTLRYVAGNIKQLREHGPSLIITRHSQTLHGRERYVPPALLQGVVPSCFLENFNMWLGEDNLIRGDPLDTSSAWFEYTLEVHVSPETGTAQIHRRPRAAGQCLMQLKAGEGQLFRSETEGNEAVATTAAAGVDPAAVAQLKNMGFAHVDAVLVEALTKSGNRVDDAVAWLTSDVNVARIIELSSQAPLVAEAPAGDAPMPEEAESPNNNDSNNNADDTPMAGAGDVITRQLSGGDATTPGRQASGGSVVDRDVSGLVAMLVEDGFTAAQAERALEVSGADVDVARRWLEDRSEEEIAASIAQGDRERRGASDAAPATVGDHNARLARDDLHLAALSPSSRDPLIRALTQILGSIEDLSHVLVWVASPVAKEGTRAQHTDPAAGCGKEYYAYPPPGVAKCPVPDAVKNISIIELPRLRLKLQPERDVDGEWQLAVIDQPGWFVSRDPPATVLRLLTSLPEYLLLENRAMEFRVLIPNHDIVRPQIPGVAFPRRLLPLRTSLGWEEAMDQRVYSYPIHVSRSFVISSGLGPTLYLLLLNLLSRNYKDAFRLTEGICTDVALSPDEQWVFDQLHKSEDDSHPDATACRLQVSLAVLFSPVKLKWELHEEVDQYLTVLRHVSSYCSLSADELESVLRRCAQGTPLIKNKLAVLSAGRDAVLKPPPAETGGLPWLKLFMASQHYLETHCTRVEKVAYKQPKALEDKKLFEWLWSDRLMQDDVGGGGKKLGVCFLYDCVKGAVPMVANGTNIAGTLGEFLTRWMHLKVARWGKEAVEEGEVQCTMSRSIVQLAHMLRNKSRLWPSVPAGRDATQQLKTGIELYKGEGRTSDVRSWIDQVDREFMTCINNSRLAGGSYDATTSALDALRKAPLSKDVPLSGAELKAAKEGLAGAKHRAAPTDTSCDYRPVGSGDAATLQHPLKVLCASFVEWLPRDASGLMSALPFEVPAAAASTPVARAMHMRMDADVAQYARMMSGSETPHLKHLTPTAIDTMMAGDAAATTAGLNSITRLIKALTAVQEKDAEETESRVRALVEKVNTIPLPGRAVGGSQEFTRRIIFALNRLTRSNSVVDLPYLASCFLSTRAQEDVRALNPYAPDGVPSELTPILILANRVAHASAVKGAAEALRVMLKKAVPRGGAEAASQGVPREDSSGFPRCATSGGADASAAQQTLLKIKHAARAVADTLTQKRHYLQEAGGGGGSGSGFDPRFLLFEFIFSIRLRKRQVEMVNWFRSNLAAGVSRVQQMIMGQGKTQVVSPLLVLMLADGDRMVTQVMPSALLQQSRAVFHACFGAPILPKKVFTLQFDRSAADAADAITLLHAKLTTAARDRGVVVAPPEAIKSLELKFVELLHSLESVQLEDVAEGASLRKRKEVSRLRERMLARSDMADKIVDILHLWKKGALLLDEVDVLLHPLRSELNFPIGDKQAIDLAELRWSLPMFVLDAVCAARAAARALSTPLDTFWERAARACGVSADGLLEETRAVLDAGVAASALQTTPHLVLLDQAWYQRVLKGVLAKWTALWLQRHMTSPPDVAHVVGYLMDEHVRAGTVGWAGAGDAEMAEGDGGAAAATTTHPAWSAVGDNIHDKKLLELARSWTTQLFPHTLSKIDRVGYGLLQENDMVLVDPNLTQSRLLTAVPFVGKDVPSRSSEFAHPDVVIGLTTLAYRYEGIRKADLRAVISQLKKEYSRQHGPRDRRPACVLYSRWVHAGAQLAGASAESVLSLPLFHLGDRKQFDKLYRLVRHVPHLIYYYLDNHVFPTTMNFQSLKISACGHELGSDLLFASRAGFSGTPSNLMPLDLGECAYEPGSDGDVIHTLTSTEVTSAELKTQWSAKGLLRDIACADPPYHALIDTGAYITNMDNQEVAEYLLEHLPERFEGVVFMDKQDRKMVTLRNQRTVALSQCGVPEQRRFTFYDQIHTTGMDIKQAPTAMAVVTIGKDMSFRDYAQGAYRMRGVGKGQTIRLFVVAEVQSRIDAELGPSRTGRPELDVPCWLLLNSMRMENLQAVKLGEQELQNIWRKHALRSLVEEIDRCGTQPSGTRVRRFTRDAWLRECIGEYREVISHEVDVADDGAAWSARYQTIVQAHQQFTKTDEDQRRIAKVMADMEGAAKGFVGTNLNFESEVVHEQEAEQEQEQEAEQEEQRESAFSRDDEQHNPWEYGALTLPVGDAVKEATYAAGRTPFYPLRRFKATELQPRVAFPESLVVTDNFFRPTWLGLGERRLKVAYVVLHWSPDAKGTATSLVSLAEAETLRWMLHTNHPVTRALPRMMLVTTHGSVVAETLHTPDAPMTLTLQRDADVVGTTVNADEELSDPLLLCVRFFNGEMFFAPKQLEILEAALAHAPLDDRKMFFFEAVRLRQRQKAMFADTPVAKLFTPVEEWHMIRVKGQIEYIGMALRHAVTAKGIDIRETFEQACKGRATATPQELANVIKHLVSGVSPGDLNTLIARFNRSAIGCDEFLTFFDVPLDLKPAARPAAAAEPAEEDSGPSFWSCRSCTYMNPPDATVCEVCDSGWSGARVCPRDKWVCAPETGGCSYFNSKRLFYCEICNRARPDLATATF